jgi:hypothetical protein
MCIVYLIATYVVGWRSIPPNRFGDKLFPIRKGNEFRAIKLFNNIFPRYLRGRVKMRVEAKTLEALDCNLTTHMLQVPTIATSKY